MIFARPEAFFLLIHAVGFTILLFAVLVWLRKKTHRDFEIYKIGYLKEVGKCALFCFIAALVIIGVAHPEIKGYRVRETPIRDAQVLFLVDVSKSMDARRDIYSESRLERAKVLIEEAVSHPDSFEIALYGFTSIVLSHVPFTQNRLAFGEALDKILDIESIPKPGSNMWEALETVIYKFDKEKPIKLIVLLSDGEDRSGDGGSRLSSVMKIAKNFGIKVITIGIGEENGAAIPIFENGEFTGRYETSDGEVYISYLNEDILKFIAQETDGRYFYENDKGEFLDYLDSEIVKADVIGHGEPIEHNKDLSWIFFSSALFGLLVLWIRFYN